MQPGYLSRTERDFLTGLQNELWQTDPDNPLGQKIPKGLVGDLALRRVIAIMADGRLGLALHPIAHDYGMSAWFYPALPAPRRGQPRPQLHEILVIHDQHLEAVEEEVAVIQRRNAFLDRLFPFVRTPMNKHFRDRIGIGGVIEADRLFLLDAPETPPTDELNLDDWRFYDRLNSRLWHISMQYSHRARDFHRQVPTLVRRGRIDATEFAKICEHILQGKIYASIFRAGQYNSITASLSTRPWSRLTGGARRLVLSFEAWHVRSASDEMLPREHGEQFVEIFKPFVLSEPNVAQLTKYSDGIPRLLREPE